MIDSIIIGNKTNYSMNEKKLGVRLRVIVDSTRGLFYK